jgi:glycosyltransferase involved in cell wall biosynthesis
MKIIYVGAFRFPKYDAAAARVLNNARALRECGHDVEIISWGGKFEDSSKQNGEYDIYDGFRYTITTELDINGGFVAKVKNRLNRGEKTLRLLKEIEKSPDLLIAYNPDLLFNLKLKYYASRHKIKYANDITEWSDNNELRFIERITNAINLKHFTHRVNNRIVISSFLNKYYTDGNNIVVPATYDETEPKWQQGLAVAKKRVGGFDGITLIYAGNPARKDAVHYAINAVQRLIDEGASIRFLIVGAEREPYQKTYADLLTKKDLSEKILFLGRVPQDEVPSYYALADFMVLLRESTRKSNAGFPTKFAESFASSTPVIANLTSDLNRYLFEGNTGFVVEKPTEQSVYETLKTRVLALSSDRIEQMKRNVKKESKRLDYHHFIEPLRLFMNNLI